MTDTILVHNLEFVGAHGYYPEERAEGRRFAVDLEATVSTRSAGTHDALTETVDYRDLTQIVLDIGHGPSIHLIETIAERICARILGELPRVEVITLTLRKFATGVPGDPEWVGLRITRRRA